MTVRTTRVSSSTPSATAVPTSVSDTEGSWARRGLPLMPGDMSVGGSLCVGRRGRKRTSHDRSNGAEDGGTPSRMGRHAAEAPLAALDRGGRSGDRRPRRPGGVGVHQVPAHRVPAGTAARPGQRAGRPARRKLGGRGRLARRFPRPGDRPGHEQRHHRPDQRRHGYRRHIRRPGHQRGVPHRPRRHHGERQDAAAVRHEPTHRAVSGRDVHPGHTGHAEPRVHPPAARPASRPSVSSP